MQDVVESSSEEEGDDGGVAVALDATRVTLATVDADDAPSLRAYLGEVGLEIYANTPLRELRRLARRMLERGSVRIEPAHPLLHRHSRPNRHLTSVAGEVLWGEALWQLTQQLAQAGVHFDGAARCAFLPFENTRNRGAKLYNPTTLRGLVRKGSHSHAHSKSLTAQRAVYHAPGKAAVEAYVFRMPVRA